MKTPKSKITVTYKPMGIRYGVHALIWIDDFQSEGEAFRYVQEQYANESTYKYMILPMDYDEIQGELFE